MLKHRRWLSVSTLVLVAACFGFSQTPATLSGIVKDPAGLAVSSAVVTLKNNQTSAEKKTAATDSGGYTFSDLPSGDYTLHLDAPGFKDPEKKVKVTAGEQARLDVALELAGGT